jgi:hypothetical protein
MRNAPKVRARQQSNGPRRVIVCTSTSRRNRDGQSNQQRFSFCRSIATSLSNFRRQSSTRTSPRSRALVHVANQQAQHTLTIVGLLSPSQHALSHGFIIGTDGKKRFINRRQQAGTDVLRRATQQIHPRVVDLVHRPRIQRHPESTRITEALKQSSQRRPRGGTRTSLDSMAQLTLFARVVSVVMSQLSQTQTNVRQICASKRPVL